MITIDELITQTLGDEAMAGENDALVKLRGDEPAPLVHYLLLEHLGQDDTRVGVHIEVQGDSSHYLSRAKLLMLAADKSRGLAYGESGGSALAGSENDRLIKLCCRKKGCKCKFYVVNYNEDKPPHCDDHSDTNMEPCP